MRRITCATRIQCIYTQSERFLHINDVRAAHPPGVLPSLYSPAWERRSNNMIPDDTIIFNQSSALSNFDDHEARLRHLLQQDALPTLKDSRHLLSVCEEVDI